MIVTAIIIAALSFITLRESYNVKEILAMFRCERCNKINKVIYNKCECEHCHRRMKPRAVTYTNTLDGRTIILNTRDERCEYAFKKCIVAPLAWAVTAGVLLITYIVSLILM